MDNLDRSKALTTSGGTTQKIEDTPTTAIATSDSSDGSVWVDFGGDTVSYSGGQSVMVSTTVAVKNGDQVRVSLIGPAGSAKTPIVTGVIGGGDRTDASVKSAQETATDAKTVIYGIASSNSSDGSVNISRVWSGYGDTTWEELGNATWNDTNITIPTTVVVKAGDKVQVTLVGDDKTPTVTGVVGGGDRDMAEVNAVKNYFFHDDEGAHVTTTENDATTGSNALLAASELQFRDGTNTLAKFASSLIELGMNLATTGKPVALKLCNAITINASSGDVALATISAGNLEITASGTLNLKASYGVQVNGKKIYTWTQIATFSDNGSTTFASLDVKGYSEVMVSVYRASVPEIMTAIVPIQLISTTSRNVYLTGGASGMSGRDVVANLSLTSCSYCLFTADAVNYTTGITWYVYAR